MLAAANERRRRRGEPELTEEEMQERVREDRRISEDLRDRYLADADLRQMLDATNERRRRRGEPELTEAQYRAQLEADRERLERG
jgi:signal transduction histidine kinase